MTLKEFFVGRAAVFAVVLVVALVAFLGKTYLWPTPALPPEEAPVAIEPSRFLWRFAPSDSLNPDGIPSTDIFLEVTYANGSKESRAIDTTHASCNELPDTLDEHAAGTNVIQCYGAGLGYRYKIVGAESSYLIQRKEFEEASPGYEPVAQEYQTVFEIP